MIRRDFLRTAGTAAIAGMVALSPMTGAFAADQQTAAATAPASVPVLDARKFSDKFLLIAAAAESKDAVLIIVYGNNAALREQVKAGAQDAVAEGFPVKGILEANGKDGVEIYAHTQIYSTHNDPDDGIRFQTKVEVMKAYRDVIIPSRKQAALQSGAPAAAVTN